MLAIFALLLSIMIVAYKKLSDHKEKLAESLNNFQTLLDSTRDVVVVYDKNLSILLVNKTGLELFGYTLEEALAMKVSDFTNPGNDEIISMIQAYNTNVAFEVELFKKDGTILPCLASGKNIIYKGKPARVSILTNLTDIKKA